MEYQWVIGKFNGEKARSVLDHAGAGIGYFIRQQNGVGKNIEVEAAFRRAMDSPIPEHLVEATPKQVEVLEKMLNERSGVLH